MITWVILLFPWLNRRTVTTVLHHRSEEKAGLLWGRTISLWQVETILKAAGEIQGNTPKSVIFSIDVPVWGCLPSQEAIRKNSVINCIVDRWVCVLFCFVCMLFVCLFVFPLLCNDSLKTSMSSELFWPWGRYDYSSRKPKLSVSWLCVVTANHTLLSLNHLSQCHDSDQLIKLNDNSSNISSVEVYTDQDTEW